MKVDPALNYMSSVAMSTQTVIIKVYYSILFDILLNKRRIKTENSHHLNI